MESAATAMKSAAAEMGAAARICLGGAEGCGEKDGKGRPGDGHAARRRVLGHHCAPSCWGAPSAKAMLLWSSDGVNVKASSGMVAGTVHLTVDK